MIPTLNFINTIFNGKIPQPVVYSVPVSNDSTNVKGETKVRRGPKYLNKPL